MTAQNDASAYLAAALASSSNVRGAGASAPSNLRGLLQSIGFEQSDAGLTLDLSATGPIRVSAAPISKYTPSAWPSAWPAHGLK